MRREFEVYDPDDDFRICICFGQDVLPAARRAFAFSVLCFRSLRKRFTHIRRKSLLQHLFDSLASRHVR